MRKTNKEAKLMVAQAYWLADQAYKQAESKRGKMRDLALVAVTKGETVGPVADDQGMAHWLTHGEKERVEMSSIALWHALADTTHMTFEDVIELCDVNVSRLKEALPAVYNKLLKHRSTKRTTHPCLTWSEKTPKRKAKR